MEISTSDLKAAFKELTTKEDLKMLIEMMNKRFENMRYCIDKRVGFLGKLIVGFNLPILMLAP